MAVKLIAVDMDGTFLKSDQDYNRERFRKIYSQIQRKKIRFVVASGNQYAQLKSFFPEIAKEISFISENGAYCVHEGTELFSSEMAEHTVSQILNVLKKYEEVDVILCGKKSAYIDQTVSVEFENHAIKYYHLLKRIPDMYSNGPEVDGSILKIALTCPPEKTSEILNGLQVELKDSVSCVSSGHGDIDLIIPGIHKANALGKLAEHLDIQPEEVVAFGDGGNDLEMLAFAGYSYAMANGQEKIKKTAKFKARSNDEEGVLEVLENLILESRES
ncbi:5-amino-6-(5-phospho-D-ribitylamino)uracil phosphatase YbjI [bioreactor metagenome]|uniref:5-amino-6-(5-phospho-D-ribitylamino)uracil phosphatase YbjI n=1 Tax=bioreactor metagenome TaxID=1076179 RepID=A0A644YBH3_9ZZZZ